LEVSSLNKDREPFLHFYLDDVYDCILKTLSLSERRKEESKGLPIESVHLQLNTKVSSIYIQSLENELDKLVIGNVCQVYDDTLSLNTIQSKKNYAYNIIEEFIKINLK
jgi:uncharacterized NAD(P)/FAD-binding protein YdhS